MASPLGWLLVLGLYKEVFFYIFKMCVRLVTQGHLTRNRAFFPSFFLSFVQLTHLNQNLHLLSRENIIFIGIRAVYVYQILFNEIFMFFIVLLYKTI